MHVAALYSLPVLDALRILWRDLGLVLCRRTLLLVVLVGSGGRRFGWESRPVDPTLNRRRTAEKQTGEASSTLGGGGHLQVNRATGEQSGSHPRQGKRRGPEPLAVRPGHQRRRMVTGWM